jgi:ATPase subunit of ABC transporter with duplicated ATPase domains
MEERRGRPKEIIHEPAPRKFIRVYEDELTTETWKFDLDKFDKGPIEVDVKYKAGAEKLLKQMAKEAKQQKKIAKQMKKINEKGTNKNK